MFYNYTISGFLLKCKDPEYIMEDNVSLRVQLKPHCLRIANIIRESGFALQKITWVIEQYKCSSSYHNKEPLKLGGCVDCRDDALIEMKDMLQESLSKISTLNANIISKNYNIKDTQSLCQDILGELSTIQEMSTDIREAFYIEPTLLDGILNWFGVSSSRIEAHFTRLSKYVSCVNTELAGLDKLLPVEEI